MRNIINILKHNLKTTLKGWFGLILILPIAINIFASFIINNMNMNLKNIPSHSNVGVYTRDTGDVFDRLFLDKKFDSIYIENEGDKINELLNDEVICSAVFIDSDDIYTDIKNGNKDLITIKYNEEYCDGGHVVETINTGINKIQTFGDTKEEYIEKFDYYNDIEYEVSYKSDDLEDKMIYLNMFGIFGMLFLFIGIRCLSPFINERESKIDKRILISKVSKLEYSLGHILGCFIVLLLQSITLLGTFYMMNSDFNIDLGWMMILSFALSFVGIGVGLIILSISNNSSMYYTLSSIIITPVCLVSGGFVPTEFMPEYVQKFSLISPLTWINSAFKSILLNSNDYMDIGLDIMASIAISIVLIMVYLIIEYRKKDKFI